MWLSASSIYHTYALTRIEKQSSDLEIELDLVKRRNEFNSVRKLDSFLNTSGISAGGSDGGREASVIQEHIAKLEAEILSLNRQVAFVKDSKTKSEEKYTESMQRLVKQLANLNDLYTQAKQEKEDYFHQLCEKETSLQLSIVHLQAAQEDMKKLMNEKAQHFKLRRESMQEL